MGSRGHRAAPGTPLDCDPRIDQSPGVLETLIVVAIVALMAFGFWWSRGAGPGLWSIRREREPTLHGQHVPVGEDVDVDHNRDIE
jgi:hypothetical protein